MAAEHADGAVAVTPPDVLHVGVVDLLAEGADELHVVDALVAEVAGVVVEAETLVVADGVERALGGGDVEGDLGRVHFEAEVDVVLLEDLEDGLPALGEVVVALLQVGLVGGREGVDRVPDGGTGEAVDDGLAGALRLVGHVSLASVEELAGGLGGQGHLGARALTDAFRITVTPDVGGQDALVALVDVVAGGLADEVRGDRPAAEVVLREKLPDGLDVARLVDGADDVEVVAPAGELDAFVAHRFDLGQELGDLEVGPLAGEEGNRAL